MSLAFPLHFWWQVLEYQCKVFQKELDETFRLLLLFTESLWIFNIAGLAQPNELESVRLNLIVGKRSL